jgi:hypothetical protein
MVDVCKIWRLGWGTEKTGCITSIRASTLEQPRHTKVLRKNTYVRENNIGYFEKQRSYKLNIINHYWLQELSDKSFRTRTNITCSSRKERIRWHQSVVPAQFVSACHQIIWKETLNVLNSLIAWASSFGSWAKWKFMKTSKKHNAHPTQDIQLVSSLH